MVRKSRLSQESILKRIDNFVVATAAGSIAVVCGVSVFTLARWYHSFRGIICNNLEKLPLSFDAEVETDESYCGGKIKEKHGLGS